MEKMRQWSMLTALGVVGVLAAGWFLLVSPQRSHASELATQVTSKQAATASLQSQVNQLRAQQKDEPAQQRRLMQIASQVPDNPALPTLIRELSAAAHTAGVSLVSLSPAPPSPVTPTTSAASAPLAQIPITISVAGSYFNVESFFRGIEHLDRAMMVTGFNLVPGAVDATDPSQAVPGGLTGQIQAVVFESPSTAPAPPATTPSVATAPTATAPTAATSTTPAGPAAPAASTGSAQ